MRINKKEQAYTLAEIMVVVLVLSIIFAAFAPIFTKRRLTSYTSKYAVWQVADSQTFDAFYNPGDPSFTGQLFFGVTPENLDAVKTTYLPLSKIVVRSGPILSDNIQKQIQFRYARSSVEDKGEFAGTWFMNGKNVLLGGAYRNMNVSTQDGARNNVAIGYQALNTLRAAQGNVAIGYHAASNMTDAKYNVAIGYEAGKSNNSNSNTFVGAGAGTSSSGSGITAIGYNAGRSSGSYNLYIGSYAGNASASATKNVGIGHKALAKLNSGSYNTAIGYNALGNLTTGSYNIAIGYNACSEVTTASYKTCIGYNSGPHNNSSAERYLQARTNSSSQTQRTYIGSQPGDGFGGDAVLEIHNVKGGNNMTSVSKYTTMESAAVMSNETTVINGNLIVRGRPYFTVGTTLHHFHDKNVSSTSSYVYGYKNTADSYYKKCSTSQKGYNFSTGCVKLDTSDRRLKNIGTRFTAGIDEINKLKVYNFTFKNDPDKKPHVGVLAQELQKVFPTAVFEDSEGILRIRWDEMFFATINAIKELDRKIVAITNRVINVENQIADLEKENTDLKNQVDQIALRINKLKNQ